MLNVVDLEVADLALSLAEFDWASESPELVVVDLVLAVFDPDRCQMYPTSSLPSAM